MSVMAGGYLRRMWIRSYHVAMERRVVIIQGSPRAGGNTEAACRYVEQRIRDSMDVRLVNLHEMDIGRCTGCRKCMDLGDCVLRDDFTRLWEDVRGREVIVQAAPVYWYAPPGLMKDFIDRTHATFTTRNSLSGATGHLITVAADSGFETTEQAMSSWIIAYGGRVGERVRILARDLGELEGREENFRALDVLVDAILRV